MDTRTAQRLVRRCLEVGQPVQLSKWLASQLRGDHSEALLHHVAGILAQHVTVSSETVDDPITSSALVSRSCAGLFNSDSEMTRAY